MSLPIRSRLCHFSIDWSTISFYFIDYNIFLKESKIQITYNMCDICICNLFTYNCNVRNNNYVVDEYKYVRL